MTRVLRNLRTAREEFTAAVQWYVGAVNFRLHEKGRVDPPRINSLETRQDLRPKTLNGLLEDIGWTEEDLKRLKLIRK